jgi:recombination protein U
MANKGKGTEDVINLANNAYLERGIAWVDKMETAAVIKRSSKNADSPSFKKAPPVLDYTGVLFGGRTFKFDAKESEFENGLPLAHIRDNQMQALRLAAAFKTPAFLIVYEVMRNRYYRVDGETVLKAYDHWQAHKGHPGCNLIEYIDMFEVRSHEGIALDCLAGYYEPIRGRATIPQSALRCYLERGR